LTSKVMLARETNGEFGRRLQSGSVRHSAKARNSSDSSALESVPYEKTLFEFLVDRPCQSTSNEIYSRTSQA
jgi:hypothetical protein